ncbi:MAG: hypothetical protein AAGK66_05250 [Pseudomonadota bacterium]
MADGVALNQTQHASSLFLDLEEAVRMLETAQLPSDTDLSVKVRDRILAFSAECISTGDAHRRLVGLLQVMSALQNTKIAPEALQRRKPVLHADVAQILDALRDRV